jgi:hypothetical protein
MTSKSPKGTAASIGARYSEGDDQYVIVRADVVEGGSSNVVVPVDAASEDDLNDVLDLLRAAPGVEGELTVLKVKEKGHNPWPPHRSHTFVTEEEFDEFEVDEYKPPGRHPKSPGRNGWG